MVAGDFIGTDVTGTTAFDSSGNTLGNTDGIIIIALATDNTVGGTAAGAGNLISGNVHGVQIAGTGTTGNVVAGDFIGTDVTGRTAVDTDGKSLGNGAQGVVITGGASDNTVGGTATGARNIISGNQGYGVYLTSAGTSGNVVAGDFIGTDVTGTTAFDSHGHSLGNTTAGVAITFGASDNTIGGSTAGSPRRHLGQRESRCPDRHERHEWQRGRRRFHRHRRHRPHGV